MAASKDERHRTLHRLRTTRVGPVCGVSLKTLVQVLKDPTSRRIVTSLRAIEAKRDAEDRAKRAAQEQERFRQQELERQRAANAAPAPLRAGIVVFADNILGIPGGTLEDDFATLQLDIDLDVDYAAATLCTPYPGTGIAKYAIDNGYFKGDFELIDDSYYTESVIEFASESEKRQTENLHKFFAVTAAIPQLLPIVKRLIKLPPNDYF
jgi:hypothetical protein